MTLTTRSLSIAGPTGALECLIDRQQAGECKGSVVIAHPHPLFAGSMHNKIVHTIARAYAQSGWQAIRFNFRGVGASGGGYDGGRGEVDDLLAVISQLAQQRPLVLAGFSFGTIVTLDWLQQQDSSNWPIALTLVGVPTQRFAPAPMPAQLREKSLVIHGGEDEVAPLDGAMAWAQQSLQPLMVVPKTGHFFHNNLTILKALVINQIKALG